MLTTPDAPADLRYRTDSETGAAPSTPVNVANSTSSAEAPAMLIVNPRLPPPSPQLPMPNWRQVVGPISGSSRAESIEDNAWPADGLLGRESPMSGKQCMKRLTGC